MICNSNKSRIPSTEDYMISKHDDNTGAPNWKASLRFYNCSGSNYTTKVFLLTIKLVGLPFS
jgi:hypothetical protein